MKPAQSSYIINSVDKLLLNVHDAAVWNTTGLNKTKKTQKLCQFANKLKELRI
jgi:hypothetical protein